MRHTAKRFLVSVALPHFCRFLYHFFYHRNCEAKQYNNGRWSQSACVVVCVCVCRTVRIRENTIFLTAFHFIVAFSYRLRRENNTKLLGTVSIAGRFALHSYYTQMFTQTHTNKRICYKSVIFCGA